MNVGVCSKLIMISRAVDSVLLQNLKLVSSGETIIIEYIQ